MLRLSGVVWVRPKRREPRPCSFAATPPTGIIPSSTKPSSRTPDRRFSPDPPGSSPAPRRSWCSISSPRFAMTHSGKVIGNLMIDLNPIEHETPRPRRPNRARADRSRRRNRSRHPRSDRLGRARCLRAGWGERERSPKLRSLLPLGTDPCLIRTGRRRAFANPSAPAIPPSPRRASSVPLSGVSDRSGPALEVVGKPLPERPSNRARRRR
jgi:hypothetical protein